MSVVLANGEPTDESDPCDEAVPTADYPSLNTDETHSRQHRFRPGRGALTLQDMVSSAPVPLVYR